jgi:hypothetical protein
MMAKGAGKKNGSRNDKAAVAAATSSPAATTMSTEDAVLECTPAVVAARPAPRPAVSAGRSPVERHRAAPPGVVEWVGEVGAASLRSVQMVLPTARTPVILLGAGLLVAGVVELPVVVGAGLVYEALRQWQPRAPRVER